MNLAARVDAILTANGASPAVTSLTIAVHCRRCRHDRVNDPGPEVVAIEQPTDEAALARVHTRCLRCRRGWTFTATCMQTRADVAELHDTTAA